MKEEIILPKIIAVDFDGTIVTKAYPAIGELKLNVVKVLKKLREEGFYLIIWTCRYDKWAEDAKRLLAEVGIEYHAFNEHCPDIKTLYNNDTRKISADLYIDDLGLGGIPEDWDETYILVHRHFENLKYK